MRRRNGTAFNMRAANGGRIGRVPASIGAIKLSQLCAEIETMIRLETGEDLDARVDAMGAEVEIVLQALRSLMDVKP